VRVYRSLEEIADLGSTPRAVAIGVFDGVHVGHQAIIGMAVEAAAAMGGVSTVVTFEPHPEAVLHKKHPPPTITPLELKIDLLERIGVQEVVAVPFDEEFASLGAEEFCRRLLSLRLGARQVLVGDNFRFGRGGAGTPADLLAFGQEQGFAVKAISLVQDDGLAVSSTRIRSLIERGELEEASRLLGRPHVLVGRVVPGAGRGRKLGMPTANIEPPPGVVIPALGVYVTRVRLERGMAEASVTSVGTNPTFECDNVVRIETFLLDFKGSLYDQTIELEFLSRLRGQRTFPDPGSLVAQMERDVTRAREYVSRS